MAGLTININKTKNVLNSKMNVMKFIIPRNNAFSSIKLLLTLFTKSQPTSLFTEISAN